MEEKVGIEELLKGPITVDGPKGPRTWDFSQKRGEIIPFPSNPNRTLEQQARSLGLMNPKLNKFMQKGDIQVGKAPKTKKSTLDAKKERDILFRDADEDILRIKKKNKDAIRRFKEKNPDKFYAGGIAPLVGEPSYAAHFYDDRTPMAGGALVKGGRWFLKSLYDTKKQLMQLDIPLSQKKELMKQADDAIKQIEGGAPIPEQIIQHIRKDPKFKSVSQGPRATDPDLAEMEEVILEYGKRHADGGRVSFSGGGKAGLPAITQETQTPQLNMQGPQMPAPAPQPAGISGANFQQNQMDMYQQQMNQNPWQQQMQQGKGGMQNPQYKGQFRMPFGIGGLTRRAFLKMMAAGAALPFMPKAITKLAPKAVPKVVETVASSNASGMPVWFPKLVERVIKEGDDVTKTAGTVERQTVHRATTPEGTPIEVTQDLTTGNTFVDIGEQTKHGWSAGRHGQPTRLVLNKGEWIEPTKGKPGVKTKDEFFVEEAEFTGGHPENIKFEESAIEKYGDHASDFTEIEKFAVGKNTDKKIIGSKRARDDWAEGRAEVEAEDVEFASGGIARLLGE